MLAEGVINADEEAWSRILHLPGRGMESGLGA